MQRRRMDMLTIVSPKASEIGLAEANALLKHRLEHGCEIAGRGIDDLKDFGRGGLARHRLVALGGTLGELIPKIVDALLKLSECAVGCRGHLRSRRAVLRERL